MVRTTEVVGITVDHPIAKHTETRLMWRTDVYATIETTVPNEHPDRDPVLIKTRRTVLMKSMCGNATERAAIMAGHEFAIKHKGKYGYTFDIQPGVDDSHRKAS